MKIVEIYAGLGNQMFQVAFALALSKRCCDEICLYNLCAKDYNDEGRCTLRPYGLDCYHVPFRFVTKKVYTKVVCGENFWMKICRKRRREKGEVQNKVVEKVGNIYQPKLFEEQGSIVYEGYFQTEKYFRAYRSDVLQMFRLKGQMDQKNKEMLDQIRRTNSVSLHVRRGDYLRLNKTFQLCSLNYYKKAIDYIAAHVENPHFYFFSNDLQWMKENLKIEYPYTLVDLNDSVHGYYDIELMRQCKHNIIANSTFSWWGAWLNENPNKIVIAPSEWFTEQTEFKTGDVMPDEWIKIKDVHVTRESRGRGR